MLNMMGKEIFTAVRWFFCFTKIVSEYDQEYHNH